MNLLPLLIAANIAAGHQQLQKWQFTTQPIAITAPVTFSRDTATWTLRSGLVRLMAPLGGRVTGLVFEGDGRFTMTVPDRIELQQLRRFTARRDLQSIDASFKELVFRTSDDTIDRLFPNASRPPFAPNGLATNRHNHWLIDLRTDVDAATLAAMTNHDGLAITAAIRTSDFDWLDYEYDWTRQEEVQLTRWLREFPEVWLSLDAVADNVRPARLDAIDVRADLTRYSLSPNAGETHQRKINGHYVVEETITPLRAGLAALRLQLDPTAHDVIARDANGSALTVIRDHIGARSASIENKYYDPLLTLFFPEPLPRDQPQRVTFEYDLETENYALGRSWYPTFAGTFDAHTARLDLLVNRRNEIRSMGTLQSETETERGKRSVWIIAKPTVMVTFSTAEHFEEATVELPGVPPVISFGTVARLDPGKRIRNAAIDVANCVQFFQVLLDDKLDTPRLFVTSITDDHGQAFDGFLHLAEASYRTEPGAEELYRAHETAHEWFGLKVGWKSYRDQWLTESFAEYLGMMFVEASVKNGPQLFQQILDSYSGILLGNMSGGFSKFSQPWLVMALRNSSFRSRLGPIGHGYRAGTGDIPFGYMVQTYYKGPLVLHMLRMLLRFRSGSDDLFIKVLLDFVYQYSGRRPSTADFQRVLERDAPGDWNWFFNAWIYSAEIPTLTWSYRVEPDAVAVTVKRSGVSDDFALIAPVRIEFDGAPPMMIFVPVRQSEQTIRQSVPARPHSVIFAPDHSLLARIRRQ